MKNKKNTLSAKTKKRHAEIRKRALELIGMTEEQLEAEVTRELLAEALEKWNKLGKELLGDEHQPLKLPDPEFTFPRDLLTNA